MNRLILCGVLAAACFTAIGCGPTLTERRDIAVTNFLKNDFEQAKVEFRAIVEKWPQDTASYHYLGLIYHAEGQREKAISYYQFALNVDPGYEPARRDLARVKDEIPNGQQLIHIPTPGQLPKD